MRCKKRKQRFPARTDEELRVILRRFGERYAEIEQGWNIPAINSAKARLISETIEILQGQRAICYDKVERLW
jgi:hypothetical protein